MLDALLSTTTVQFVGVIVIAAALLQVAILLYSSWRGAAAARVQFINFIGYLAAACATIAAAAYSFHRRNH